MVNANSVLSRLIWVCTVCQLFFWESLDLCLLLVSNLLVKSGGIKKSRSHSKLVSFLYLFVHCCKESIPLEPSYVKEIK